MSCSEITRLYSIIITNLRDGDLDEPGIGTVLRDLLNEHKIQLSDEKLQSALRSMYAVTQTNWFLEDDAIPTLQVLLKSSYSTGDHIQWFR